MNIKEPAVIIGMGEMGGVFARSLLRSGHPVVPVLRSSLIGEIAAQVSDPLLTLVTVGESDLDSTLESLPAAWRTTTGLLQNELLPRNWLAHGIEDPTVAVVWFEKKAGRDVRVIIPTPISGPGAGLLVSALSTVGIPAREVADADDILFELVRKNMYILTANIGGLMTRDTVHDLWYNHRAFAEDVAVDIVEIQQYLTGTKLDAAALIEGMVEAFDADPEHGATGRSAPARLARAIDHADQAGLAVPHLRSIQSDLD
jgi:hypothetical protein